jgi:hypothetical protein
MRVLRKVAVAAATAVLGVGLIAISAPAANADSSWGPRPPAVTP